MVRIWTSGLGTIGPKLRPNLAWRMSLALLGALGLLQTTALTGAVISFLGRATGSCLVASVCAIEPDVGNLLSSLLAITLISASISILSVLWKLAKALRDRQGWTMIALRFTGGAAAAGGLILAWVGGLPWAVLGLGLYFVSKRLQLEQSPNGPRNQRPNQSPRRGASLPDDVIDGERV